MVKAPKYPPGLTATTSSMLSSSSRLRVEKSLLPSHITTSSKKKSHLQFRFSALLLFLMAPIKLFNVVVALNTSKENPYSIKWDDKFR